MLFLLRHILARRHPRGHVKRIWMKVDVRMIFRTGCRCRLAPAIEAVYAPTIWEKETISRSIRSRGALTEPSSGAWWLTGIADPHEISGSWSRRHYRRRCQLAPQLARGGSCSIQPDAEAALMQRQRGRSPQIPAPDYVKRLVRHLFLADQ